LRSERPGAFAITTAPDAQSADAALRDRTAYAAFVVDTTGPSVVLHVASAASPTVATLLSQAAQQLGGGSAVTVVDVVPGPTDDPRGAGYASGFLPLVLVSLIAAVLLSIVVASKVARLTGLTVFAVLAGLVGAGVMRWLGVLSGDYVTAAGVVALLTFAISAAVVGLAALLGRAGIAVGALLVFLFGNPISGVAAAPELLPQPWGAIGQLLPAGAGSSLLRSAAFFDGAGASAPLWTLAGWAGAGLLLLAVGRARPIIRSAEGPVVRPEPAVGPVTAATGPVVAPVVA
jgi:hypothetical protein